MCLHYSKHCSVYLDSALKAIVSFAPAELSHDHLGLNTIGVLYTCFAVQFFEHHEYTIPAISNLFSDLNKYLQCVLAAHGVTASRSNNVVTHPQMDYRTRWASASSSDCHQVALVTCHPFVRPFASHGINRGFVRFLHGCPEYRTSDFFVGWRRIAHSCRA